MPTEQPSTKARVVFTVLLVLLSVGLLELGSYVAVGVLMAKGWMAYIPRFTEAQKDSYLRQRDARLGWAFVNDSAWGPATDSSGAVRHPIPRPDPAFSRSSPACISAYGDSFVYGTDGPDSAAYPHHLGVRLGCRVSNFGVPGYGSDQALMLFRAQATVDSAPIVIFQHLTENVLRNVNRYANLLYPGSPLRFKPRFVLVADSIAYLRSPVASRADFQRVIDKPDSALAPDGLLARPRRQFPFSIAIIRWLATDMKLRAALRSEPSETAFHRPAHPAHGFELTVAILTAAMRDAAAEGKRGVIVLQMTRQSLILAHEKGRFIERSMFDTLRGRGLRVIDLAPDLLAALGDRDPCELFVGCTQTHLNSEGNRIVARLIADYLAKEGLIATDSTR